MTDIKNSGLKLRPTYDELVNYVANKQDKIKLPNRLAKQLRNSNQLSNLLDGNGEGLMSMELQQQNIIKEQLKALTSNAMADANSTAKVFKIASTQAIPPINPKFFDIAQDDNLEKLSNDIEMVSTQQSQQVAQNKTKFTNLLQAHLDDMSPNSMDIAHVMASSSNASSSNYMPPVPMLIDKELKRSPEEEHEPKGKVGRPKMTQQSDPSAGSSLPPQPMLIDTDAKRTQIPSNTPINKKSKKQPVSEALNDNDADPEITGGKQKKGQPAPSSSSNVKKSIDKQTVKQTETHIQPSKMNIQLLREKLEHAKINNKLSSDDASAYTAMYNTWLASKGKDNEKVRKEQLAGMRKIYKRVLYKK